jgi:hypothetical protein
MSALGVHTPWFRPLLTLLAQMVAEPSAAYVRRRSWPVAAARARRPSTPLG